MISMTNMINMTSAPEVTKPAVAHPKPETAIPKTDEAKPAVVAPSTNA
jgi:hypothetical protein